MSKIKGAIAIAAVALFLGGCGQLKSLPTEERYQFINQVKDEVDLPSAGKIVSGGYDTGDGVFSPSIYRVRVEGNDSYQLLKDRIKALPEVKDCIEGKTQITCRKGGVDIFLTKDGLPESITIFELTDVSSGRTSK